MKFRSVLCLASLFFLCFTLAASGSPRPSQPTLNSLYAAAATQSVIGKVAAVGDANFSLEVQKSQEHQTLQFFIDGDTKVEGKLAVGAQASVEYRTEGDKNIAVRVVVTQASGR